MNIFHTFFYQPLLNTLILLYDFIPGRDFGLAVILLTLLIRFLLFPVNSKSIKSQKAISELEPKLKAIRKQFEGSKDKIAKETMNLYKEAKINPFSGTVLILIQLPILFALYKVFTKGIYVEELKHLYSFVPKPGALQPMFLTVDLSRPDFPLSVIAGILQFFQTKMQSPKTSPDKKDSSDFSQILQKQMLYFFPFFTFLILLKIPSAIALYLVISTLFSIFQTLYVQKHAGKC